MPSAALAQNTISSDLHPSFIEHSSLLAQLILNEWLKISSIYQSFIHTHDYSAITTALCRLINYQNTHSLSSWSYSESLLPRLIRYVHTASNKASSHNLKTFYSHIKHFQQYLIALVETIDTHLTVCQQQDLQLLYQESDAAFIQWIAEYHSNKNLLLYILECQAESNSTTPQFFTLLKTLWGDNLTTLEQFLITSYNQCDYEQLVPHIQALTAKVGNCK
jgi:hypothetical protein